MRVISMVPSWTETLVDCGVDVVGRTRFCIHPKEKVQSIPAVGGTKDIKWEKVAELKADCLLLDQEENPKFMADQASRLTAPLSVLTTHIRSVADVSRDLMALSQSLQNEKLADLALRWSRFSVPPPQAPTSIAELPGVLEWINPPGPQVETLLYLIWHKPWMAVSPNTFIGSVLRTLGYGDKLLPFETPYPEVDLEKYDPVKTALLCSTEPFPFARKKEMLAELPFPVAIVDGECFSWFGSRSLRFLEARAPARR